MNRGITVDDVIKKYLSEIGKRGGKKKTPAKIKAARENISKATASMTPEQRTARARKAASRRWEGRMGEI